jgi:hypothetical protein
LGVNFPFQVFFKYLSVVQVSYCHKSGLFWLAVGINKNPNPERKSAYKNGKNYCIFLTEPGASAIFTFNFRPEAATL